MRIARVIVPPLIVFVAVVALAELVVRRGWLPSFLVPTPSSVALSAYENFTELRDKTGETLKAAVLGFALSGLIGIAIAVTLASARWVERAFYPFAVFLQTVPIIAIAPLLVIWIGFDLRTVVVSAFIVSVFPVIANTLSGLRSTDPSLCDLFRLYGASPLASMLKLRLPFALPNIFTGLRIAAGLAVIGAIVGEFITGGGIGGIIEVARQQQDVNKIFAVLLIGSVLGITLFGGVNLASRLTLRHWHASEKEKE
jgi:NitT/TauT family transport system permease protein